MSSAKTQSPYQTARTVRTSSILCIIVGPATAAISTLSFAGTRWLQGFWQQRPELKGVELPPIMQCLLSFTEASLVWMLTLGALLTASGLYARARPVAGVRVLSVTAWITVAILIALTGVWSLQVEDLELHAVFHGFGVAAHGIQAVLVGRVARFFGRRDVRNRVAAHYLQASETPEVP